ncbi:putative carboxylesterase 18 [Glycine max]|nr:putative carboxylesterase 18 [Glycine max]
MKSSFAVSPLSTFTTASRRSNGTVNRRLFNLFNRKLPPNPTTVNSVSSSDVTVDPTRNLSFRLSIRSFAVVPIASLPEAVCRLFCHSLNDIVVSVNNRLALEHRYPSQYDDGYHVLKFIDQNFTVLPHVADIMKCFLAADSAGGNLAHHVAVRICTERL